MADDGREAIVKSMFEGILAAYYATVKERNPPFDDCHTFAHAALASLESDGFKVVRNA